LAALVIFSGFGDLDFMQMKKNVNYFCAFLGLQLTLTVSSPLLSSSLLSLSFPLSPVLGMIHYFELFSGIRQSGKQINALMSFEWSHTWT
jgi:hypothetical protein